MNYWCLLGMIELVNYLPYWEVSPPAARIEEKLRARSIRPEFPRELEEDLRVHRHVELVHRHVLPLLVKHIYIT